MTDEEVARLRAHDGNISHYRRLLKTDLSDLSDNIWSNACANKSRLRLEVVLEQLVSSWRRRIYPAG